MSRTPTRGSGFSNPNTPEKARNRAITEAIEAIQADSILALFVAFLARLPLKRRHAAIWSFEFWWTNLLHTDRAKVVRSYRKNATEAEVARWSGVSERSLHRWQDYKAIRRSARREWPVGYKDRNGQFDAWNDEPDG